MSDVSAIPKEDVVAALEEVWTSIDDLYAGFTLADWQTPTDLPGWSVRDLLSHMIGTESMLLGRPAPTVDITGLAHVRNDIGRFNEAWVEYRRGAPTDDVLAEFRAVIAARRRALHEMDQKDFDAESWTPAGQATYGRFMQIRVFDCWMHEQDAREAVGNPGGLDGSPAEMALAEIVRALGFIVGKRVGAPEGSGVRFELTGPLQRTIDVAVEGRARVVDRLAAEPSATLTTDSATFCRLAGGRIDPEAALEAGRVHLSGDADLAGRLARNLAFVM
jgi:uncharacterized protein (TIGR03083 family)